jgi:hypothetical protein
MRRVAANVLRLASVPVGVVIGLWTASLSALRCHYGIRGPSIPSCALPDRLPTFAAWECALFGASAAVVLVLVAEGVTRLRSPS